jgi:hypothetical protein
MEMEGLEVNGQGKDWGKGWNRGWRIWFLLKRLDEIYLREWFGAGTDVAFGIRIGIVRRSSRMIPYMDIVYRQSDMKCSAFNLYYCMMT